MSQGSSLQRSRPSEIQPAKEGAELLLVFCKPESSRASVNAPLYGRESVRTERSGTSFSLVTQLGPLQFSGLPPIPEAARLNPGAASTSLSRLALFPPSGRGGGILFPSPNSPPPPPFPTQSTPGQPARKGRGCSNSLKVTPPFDEQLSVVRRPPVFCGQQAYSGVSPTAFRTKFTSSSARKTRF